MLSRVSARGGRGRGRCRKERERVGNTALIQSRAETAGGTTTHGFLSPSQEQKQGKKQQEGLRDGEEEDGNADGDSFSSQEQRQHAIQQLTDFSLQVQVSS